MIARPLSAQKRVGSICRLTSITEKEMLTTPFFVLTMGRGSKDNTFFGESAVFDDQPYFATATILEPSEIYYIQRDDLMRLIKKTPSIAFMLIRALIRKIRLLAFQLEDLSFLDAQKRVAHILLTLGHELGVRKEDGLHIQKGITHNDLAQLTGLSRVTVTNVLNYLERLHIIRKRRCMLTIIDQERLANLLGTSSIETTGH